MIQSTIKLTTLCYQKIVSMFHLDHTKAGIDVAAIGIDCRPSESGPNLCNIALWEMAPQQCCGGSNATCGDTGTAGLLAEAVGI